MKNSLVILFLIFNISKLYSQNIDAVFKYFQNKYQIYNIDDLERKIIKTGSNNSQSNPNRDPSELVGEWELKNEEMGLYITVGTDQVAPTGGSISGLDPADGYITIEHEDFTTELNYMSLGDFFEEGLRNNNRNPNALEHAQDYVDSAATLQGQSSFDLMEEFNLSYNIDSTVVTGGLGGDDPENCEINWPEDAYHLAVYSFVSEYVLDEGGSVGCFTDDMDLDQTYAFVALEIEEQWDQSGGGDDGDSGTPQFMFMNFDVMNLFLIIFGIIPEGLENPTLLVVDPEDESAMAMVLDPQGSYMSFDIDSLSIDEENLIFSFNDLVMMDSIGTPALSADGTIGPVFYELLAGVETEIPLPSMLVDSAFSGREWYLSLYDDGTGMDIDIIEEEDYYYDTYIDTNISYFQWEATNDSAFITFLDDDGYIMEDDNIALSYIIYQDTLMLTTSIDPCTDPYYYYYYDTYEECFDSSGIGIYVSEVYDIQNFRQQMSTYLTGVETISISDDSNIPLDYKLYPAYPNPFNPITTLRYYLPKDSYVKITIYDARGRKINNFIEATQNAGYKSFQWDAINNAGKSVPAGVYFYTIEVDNYRQTKKMILLK